MNISRIYIIYLTIFFFACISSKALAINHYVDPSSTALSATGSFANPWKTISQINNGSNTFLPGDTVFFKRGQSLSGRLVCAVSGTQNAPIVYTSYGNGDLPILTNTSSDVIVMTNRQFVVIDGFKIIDKTMDLNDHAITAKISYAIVINNSVNCTIKNCDISLVGVAITIDNGSNHIYITNNYLHNLRIVRNTIGGNDDYGANGIVVGGFSNTINYNKFESCWAYCFDFDHDGGAIELFDHIVNDNTIMYNTAIECDGFIEVGSQDNGLAENTLIAYNKIINCGTIGVFHNNASFATTVNNTMYFNNVIIATKRLFSTDDVLFWMSDNTEMDVINLRNNIFWIDADMKMLNNVTFSTKLSHKNNIYYFAGHKSGIVTDPSEMLLITNNLFEDITDLNPANWDLHLLAGAPAVNFGSNVGILYDFEGQPVDTIPNVGLYEHIGSLTIARFKAAAQYTTIKCFGASANVNISAIGGTAPYTGTGEFTVVAGTYKYIVKDLVGLTDTVSVTITEPSQIVINTDNYLTVPSLNSLPNLSIVASGGTPPYLFKLNEGVFQTSGLFANISPALYNITVQDTNKCSSSKLYPFLITAINEQPALYNEIYVFPNPSASNFTLNVQRTDLIHIPLTIRVFNTAGYLVYSFQGETGIQYTLGDNFKYGIYTLVANYKNTTHAIQLFKL